MKAFSKVLATVLVTALTFSSLSFSAFANEAASTMKLMKTTGTVAVLDAKGKSASIFSGMKLANGYELATADKSYAWINLDDTKLVKLDALTNVTVNQQGKKLEIDVNTGRILIDVTKKLDNDEELNVKTGNVITGVRGTMLIVDATNNSVELESRKVVVDMLEGKTTTTASGRQIEALAGQSLIISEKLDGAVSSFSLENIANKKLPGFAAIELAQNPALAGRVKAACPEIIIPNEASAIKLLSEDILAQDIFIKDLAKNRGTSEKAAVDYKIGIKLEWYGQTSDGNYISGMNPNTGESQYIWNPIDSSGGVYHPEDNADKQPSRKKKKSSNSGGGSNPGPAPEPNPDQEPDGEPDDPTRG